jgi:hypothetical protein
MALNNRLSINLSDQDVTDINSALAVLKEKLMPVLKNLTVDETRQLTKMGNKSLAFVVKTYEHCESNPEFIPQYVNLNEFRLDIKAYEQLRQYYGFLSQLNDLIYHSMLLAGSDAYTNARAAYKSLQIGKKLDIPKACTIVDDLSARFPGKRRKKEPETSPKE